MKKILSIFLVVFILCQCFATIGAFASEGDIVEAPTMLLVKSNLDRYFLPVNDPDRLNTSGGIRFDFYGEDGSVVTKNSGSSAYCTGNTNSTNVGVGTYDDGDPDTTDMRYFVASNSQTGAWGMYCNNGSLGMAYPYKTTFELTFLDESTEEHKRTNGTGYVLRFKWGDFKNQDEYYYLGSNADGSEGYMYSGTTPNVKFGGSNRWIDLKVELIPIGTTGIKKSSYWKYHDEDNWNLIEEDVTTSSKNNKVYAVFMGAMSDDSSDTARILINDFKVTRICPPTIEYVTVDGETIESGASGIPYDAEEITVTFDQTMAEGLEDKIKLTAQDAGDADINVTTTDDRTYTIAVEEDLIAEKQYSLDLSECVSLHKLFTEEEFTFETGASPVISVSATGLSLVNWKTSNTINVEFTAPVVASTVNTDTVKLCYADGTPSDAPVIVDAAPYGANITVGQLDAWKDYKIVFTDDIVPADDGNIFNECEILFSTEHADVLEFDPNKADSKNKLLATVAANYTSGIFAATTTDEDTGLTYVSKVNDNTSNTKAKDASISFQVNSDLMSSDLSFEYIVRMSGEAPTDAKIASVNWGGKTQGASITTTNIAFAGGESFAHNNEFHNLKFNMAVNADATKRTTTGYLMTENGWEQKGTAQYDNKSVLEIAKYQAMAGQKIGPIDFARVIISTNPKADVMKSIVDYDKSEITLSLGKNMTDGNEDKIAVTYTDGTTEKTANTTAEKTGANTYTIKFNEVIRPNTEYTIDLSALTSADGVIGAQDYTFTTPAARVETPVFTLTGNTASVQVKNNTGSALTYTVIVAVYDTNNVLKSVGHDTYTLLGEGPSEVHTVSANLDKYASENKAGWTSKLMLWNGDITAAIPIRAAVDGTIQ